MATGQLSTGQIIAGRLSKSVAGSANVTLTAAGSPAESTGYLIYEFTGVLTGNIDVIWPALVDGLVIIVRNATTGAFTLRAIGPSGTGVVVPQGFRQALLCDGTNFVPWGVANGGAGEVAAGPIQGNNGAWTALYATKALPDSNYTLLPAEYQALIQNFTGTLTAGRDIIAPNTTGALAIVRNNTTGGFALTYKKSGGTGIAVAATKTAILLNNGTDWVRATADV